MLKELLVSLVVLTPTGIQSETPEINFTPTPNEAQSDTEAIGQGLTLIEGYVESREPQYYDSNYYYHDYTVTAVEWSKVPIAPCGHFTIYGVDDYGNLECLGDDIAEDELEAWMVVGTKVRHRWTQSEEWFHSIDFEIIGIGQQQVFDYYRTDGEFTYIDYTVTDIEVTVVPQTEAVYYTVWAIDPYGDEDCLADDVEELEDWMSVGTQVKYRWKTSEEWQTGDVVETIG